jgi:hypothetical protein
MPLEQARVAAVGLEGEIEQIADKRNGADGEIGGDIADMRVSVSFDAPVCQA